MLCDPIQAQGQDHRGLQFAKMAKFQSLCLPLVWRHVAVKLMVLYLLQMNFASYEESTGLFITKPQPS